MASISRTGSESKIRLWLITGEPGSGKSTSVSRIVLRVKTEGYTVGGIVTREVRDHGERQGFRLTNLSTEESATLATTKRFPAPRIGKYYVDIKSLSSLGVKALEHAREKSDLIVCDEVGPMELLSPEFRASVEASILSSLKPSLCVIHKRLADPLIEKLRKSEGARLFEVDYENRASMSEEISDDIIFRLRAGEKG